jgi:peptidoglycan/xylan/chitin deacetylase (PgdA/CDA1 family)
MRKARDAATRLLLGTGLAGRLAGSRWRRRRLLILGYHGVSLRNEHEWDPRLFVTAAFLRRRLEIVRKGGYVVLPLAEAVGRLREGTLPPRAVALTFDDGLYDFHAMAAPLLEEFDLPATVYLSTYYAVHQRPLRVLAIRYLLWRARASMLDADPRLGLDRPFDLTDEDSRGRAGDALISASARLCPDRNAQLAWLEELAARAGVSWSELCETRILHLMTMQEAADLARRGFDIQAHTHRHRTPRDESAFRREFLENRDVIERHTGRPVRHFCYPSGDTDPRFLPWLRSLGVDSATTCAVTLARQDHDSLLLPRLMDTMLQSEARFTSWLDGTASLFTLGRR